MSVTSSIQEPEPAMNPHDLGQEKEHVMGLWRGIDAGPTVVCAGAVHGNETSGLLALRRVLSGLQACEPRLRGEFVAIAGNLGAQVLEQRYIETDLNRYWLPDNIRRVLDASVDDLEYEDREMRELLDTLHEVFSRARGEVHFLDLHTSSADGDPFVCIGDTMRNRAYAEELCVPVVLGLEEQIDGSMLEYVNNLGHVTVGVEGGHHGAETSVDHHEAIIWLALVNAGLLQESDVPQLGSYRELLRRASNHLRGFMEVRHRHPIVPDDGFEMEGGFSNFQYVEAGQLLARDRDGEIHAVESGRILLPLYQGLGSDGFFIAREVHSFWLRVSSALRWLGLERVLHWLPGVHRHPGREATLVIHTGLARWFALEVFHLLGYRKRRSEEGLLVVTRRRYDCRRR